MQICHPQMFHCYECVGTWGTHSQCHQIFHWTDNLLSANTTLKPGSSKQDMNQKGEFFFTKAADRQLDLGILYLCGPVLKKTTLTPSSRKYESL